MHILITRPEPDAAKLSAQLASLGHEASVEPLLQISALPIDANAFAGAQAVVATSRNGLRALVAASDALAPARALPIFTVGPGTAELARALGFAHVIAGTGAARDLVPVITAHCDKAKGRLVHVAGETLAFDLAGALAADGIEVQKVTAYRAEPAPALSAHISQKLADGTLDAIILMSPRTAAIFAQLVDAAGLTESARRLAYVCLSEGIAAALGKLAPVQVEVAATPNSSGLLAAVARVATQSTGV